MSVGVFWYVKDDVHVGKESFSFHAAKILQRVESDFIETRT